MQPITGISRQQMRFSSLYGTKRSDNQVRFIVDFVEYIYISKLNFDIKTLKTEGRPSFNSKVFLQIYLYGYLNGIRSGRDLEKECLINIEMQWLLEDIRPNYHSISDFRKNNPIALKNSFKLFVSFLKDPDLIDGETITIDGFLKEDKTQFPVKTNFMSKGTCVQK
ncbi:transposase [Flavobacterium caseinilyticum]|uniref:transposase n=1 Tax=Flavobacterium caseinilyticum TaxID=2541732 RepID=UPI001FB6B066|nr:transposase [Flavobacterium caseinilyticum]